jgi:molecular chaperone GrpE
MEVIVTTSNEQERDPIEDLLDEAEEQETITETMENAPNDTAAVIANLQEKLKQAEAKVLRQAADTDNYIKRLNKETDDKIKYANQSLISKFLPVLDNFDLTLQHGATSSVDALLEGVKLTQKAMLDTLAKVGLVVVTPEVGSTFDPNTQEAIMLTANADMPNGCVTLVLQNGYVLEGRVVRPAKVQVNKI